MYRHEIFDGEEGVAGGVLEDHPINHILWTTHTERSYVHKGTGTLKIPTEQCIDINY